MNFHTSLHFNFLSFVSCLLQKLAIFDKLLNHLSGLYQPLESYSLVFEIDQFDITSIIVQHHSYLKLHKCAPYMNTQELKSVNQLFGLYIEF